MSPIMFMFQIISDGYSFFNLPYDRSMKITILAIGKKHDPKIQAAIEDYSARLNHYTKLEWKLAEAKTSSSMNSEQVKKIESEALLNSISEQDKIILLDETGTELSSIQNSKEIQKHLNKGTSNLVFVIGGAYGVSKDLKKRADFVWSLSKLVFPHQLVRLIVIEQLYRAHTILAGEKYHHD